MRKWGAAAKSVVFTAAIYYLILYHKGKIVNGIKKYVTFLFNGQKKVLY